MKSKNMIRLTIFVCTLFLLGFSSLSTAQQKVVIIGIDGCMANALRVANTPTVDSLLQHATVSWDALTIPPTSSGPCWSSMLTGVWHSKHGVTDNSFSNSKYDLFPPLFTRVKEFNADVVTASVVNWSPINEKIVTDVDFIVSGLADEAVARKAADFILNNNVDCLFLQFDQLDGAGHGNGYGIDIPEYMQQVERTDGYIKIVTDAINSRPTIDEEDWLVILSSDHGGLGNGHGGGSLEERNIVFVVSGKNVVKQEISKSEDILPAPQNSVRFDGSSNYAKVVNQTAFKFGSNKNFTIECMVKAKDWESDPSIISNKDWQSGGNPGFVLACTGDGGWKVNVGDGTDRVDISGGRINDDQWHHLVATFDRDGMMTIYHDGDNMGSRSMAQIGNLDSPYEFAIGQDGTLNYPVFYKGLLAEVRVWGAVLPGNLVEQGFAKSVDETHPMYDQLISYWKVDENGGMVLNDTSPHSIEAEIVGSTVQWESSSDSFVVTDFSNTPRIVDVPVTALAHLGVPLDPAWELDGKPVGLSAASAVQDENTLNEMDFQLYQNYPNPFNPTTRISFSIKNQARVTLNVHNIAGQLIATLADEQFSPGNYKVSFDATHLPTGVYIYTVQSVGVRIVKKMLYIK
jgi:hypothetical protein